MDLMNQWERKVQRGPFRWSSLSQNTIDAHDNHILMTTRSQNCLERIRCGPIVNNTGFDDCQTNGRTYWNLWLRWFRGWPLYLPSRPDKRRPWCAQL